MKHSLSAVTAYFSMEIAFSARVPVYAGGLGVLAGDSLRAAADLGIPLVAVTLLHREGYFRQTLSDAGDQLEAPDPVDPEAFFTPVDARTSIELEGRKVQVRAWRYNVVGQSGDVVPVILLDTDLPENAPQDRALCRSLYGGDSAYRLAQEYLLGAGGVRMLRAAGFSRLACFHMNEGHSALLVSELLREELQAADRRGDIAPLIAAIRERCVFTTHTPIAAGHDRFDARLAARVLPPGVTEPASHYFKDGWLDMTHTALSFSRFVNGVAQRHAEVCRKMFPGTTVHSITNGVHPQTWVSAPFAEMFDRVCAGWREDPQQLRLALRASHGEFLSARARAKSDMLEKVAERTGHRFDPSVLTLG
ncbi:MAG: alpha-glucan family phosphorylase, partial [Phycisphaerales bacterium]